MNINKNNYESFFIDYVHNELSLPDKLQVEAFVVLHPELQEELQQLKEAMLTPDLNIQIGQKESLYKKAMLPAHDQEAIESLIIRDLDGELDSREKEQLHLLLQKNRDHHQLAQRYARAKFTEVPEHPYPDKASLLKPVQGRDQRIYWITRFSAAAICLLVSGIYLWQYQPSVKIEAPITNSRPLNTGKPIQLTRVSTPSSTLPHDRITAPLKNKDQQVLNALNKKAAARRSGQTFEPARDPESFAISVPNLNPPPLPKMIPAESTNHFPIAAAAIRNHTPVLTEETEKDIPVNLVESEARENHKIREVFRKITRTVERAVYQKNDQTTEQIRIASFQIALK